MGDGWTRQSHFGQPNRAGEGQADVGAHDARRRSVERRDAH
jgi:hypothetical protein